MSKGKQQTFGNVVVEELTNSRKTCDRIKTVKNRKRITCDYTAKYAIIYPSQVTEYRCGIHKGGIEALLIEQ